MLNGSMFPVLFSFFAIHDENEAYAIMFEYLYIAYKRATMSESGDVKSSNSNVR
jgi:hypothetical protein